MVGNNELAWRPSAEMATLKSRAQLLGQIRLFFAKRDVLEVETPVLSQATVTDLHLHTFQTHFVGPGFAAGLPLFLMTSPEFHMKRLLAAGSGSIFQISKVFRNEEAGRYHNPEFTMLEWYRTDFDHHQLMDEMEQLLQHILSVTHCERETYQNAFAKILGFCPLDASLSQLKDAAKACGYEGLAQDLDDRDSLLQLLFSEQVEPRIGQNVPVMVHDFPASQAALAKINPADPRVAARFEVYFKGVELANGFYELDDAAEQLARFEQDNAKRAQQNLAPQPIDHHLLAALQHGLPKCAGVAVGVDRLVMLALNKSHIDEVIAFPVGRA